jgi:TPR repeat protein
MAAMTLDELVAQLRGVHADGLRAVVLYGSAAAAGHVAGSADYNILVLVDALPMERLGGPAAALVKAWTGAGHPPPLVMTMEEWRRSADIFPIEYADIFARHRVLDGALPTDGITVRPSDLRLQLEREAMGKLLQLRASILGVSGDAKAARALVAKSASGIVTLCRASLRLTAAPVPDDAEGVLRAVATAGGLDAAPLIEAVQVKRGATPRDSSELLRGFLGAFEGFVRWLDGVETAGGSAA